MDPSDDESHQTAMQLLPLVYNELRKLAAVKLAEEPSGQTLDPTALVHEAYLRLVGREDVPRWSGRGHFFGAAAEAMRRILIDNARQRRSQKHGNGRVQPLMTDPSAPDPDEELLALNDALAMLESRDPRKVQLVKLKYFAGLTIEQASVALGISPSTGERDWAFARAWLLRAMKGRPPA